MAQATNTQLGEIILAGDLAGNGGAQVGTDPQLKTMPGLTPGSYSIPTITVDAKGRVTAIASGGAGLVDLLPHASTTRSGIVSVGDNLYIAGEPESGFWTINFGGTLAGGTATGLSNQACAQYSFDLVVDAGAVQRVTINGSNAQTVTALVTALNVVLVGATAGLINGNIVIASNTEGRYSKIVISNVGLFGCITGFVSIGSATAGNGSCELYAKRGSNTDYGVVKIGAGIDVTDGVISVNAAGSLPAATSTTLGGVIVPTGGGLAIDGSGNLSIPLATSTTPGVITVGAGLVVAAGVVSVDLASLPAATTSVKGTVQVGNNISVTGGLISVADATAGAKGVARIGAGLSVVSGVVSMKAATAGELGAIKVGTGLAIDGAGVLSTTALPDASTSVKGIVQIGTGLSVTAGVVSTALATSGVAGVVRVGSGLTVASGVISAPVATTGTPGIISGGAAGRVTVVAGVIDIDPAGIPLTTVANTFTGAQTVAVVNIGASTSITPDFSASNVFTWAPSGSVATVNSPTGAQAGGIYTMVINTPATAMTYTWPASFKWAGGTVPASSTNGRDILSCVFDGGFYLCSYVRGFI